MKPSLNAICESFIASRDTIRNDFMWDNGYIIHVCAASLAAKGIAADSEKMAACKKLVNDKTGIFSNFRGNVKLPVITYLAASENPEEKLEKSKKIYEVLKNYFFGSEYLAYVSLVLADMIELDRADEIAARSIRIYDLMRKEHPFLTGSEDSVFAALLAFSEKSDEQLIEEMERVYTYFKRKFESNAAQSVSHVLSLTDGDADAKCKRVEFIWDSLKNAGRKYSKYYEVAALAAFSLNEFDLSEAVDDILEVDKYLEAQKGYGVFSIDKSTRLMHAVMLVSADYTCCTASSTAAVATTLAMVAAQQAAMCAVIAASAASTAAANSN
ncbi:MAG: DUF4003 domain-containing protein [Oscillospiraceae bacterium]|nr:DUF4003 domain-containing protein [Oscillospiraceae bacterium]